MLPASLAACVPVFIATPTSAWASAGASFVPSPIMATSLPPACSLRMSASLASGVASARKSSTPASSAIAAAVSGLSPVIMTVRMPISPQLARTARCMPALRMSSSSIDAEDPRRPRRRPAAWRPLTRSASTVVLELGGHGAAVLVDLARDGVGRPLADRARRRRSTPLMRVWAVNAMSVAPCDARAREGRTAPWRGRRCDRPSGVSSARLTPAGPRRRARRSVTPGSGTNSAAWRLPSVIVPVLSRSSVSTSPAASTAWPLHGDHVRAARAGPCRRCRWRRAARRSSSGSGRRAARRARSMLCSAPE